MAKILWLDLVARLTKMTEAEIEALLAEEVEKHKRPVVARRLHQRLCMLRAARERKAIMKRIGK